MSTTQSNQTPIKKYYSINELTALGIGSRTKIDRLAKQGLLKKIKIGGSVRFSADEVNAFIQSTNG
ncbi:helix-turn-helix domain-containing protein [Pasteurella multocida]|uniref:helix-turn-helix domain-containing protein n=1 Tax=Pasteurella multocida TaxID=747 RepID=UPI00202250EC|nr:helix-turn-helix domain-containing protein [Pasteurella multocida]MCL7815242.1 helix-turn-helix domain-containing protein [Pasteurella multocida]MDY0640409.1 helix-turn-helix domain-containing protein [Pasteurella multocida]HDR1027085.1 helix-turn-helix domain-containing protein [Pasteurella multocida]